jgi:hypothetical protein
MKVLSNNRVINAAGLVRFATSPNGWLIADNDMNAVYISRPLGPEFRPLAQALFLKTNQQRTVLAGLLGMAEKYASRAYMGSLTDLPDGGVIAECKFGVKEVEDAGIPFNKTGAAAGIPPLALDKQVRTCAWGMLLVRLDLAGNLVWAKRYQIHKGNAMVVPGANANEVRLIATDGLCWVVSVATGDVLQKTRVPMGASGEKVYATAQGCSCVGYTNHPSTVTRFGIDTKPIPVQSKPPYDIGADEWRCANCTSDAQPKRIWWAMILRGYGILYNVVTPRKSVASHDPAKLPSGGPADAEIRQPIALFKIPGSKSVGAAFKDDGVVYVQVLDKPSTRIKIGPGGWPAAATNDSGRTAVYYRNGDFLYCAVIDHQ